MPQSPEFELEFVSSQPGVDIDAAAGDLKPLGRVENLDPASPSVIIRNDQAWKATLKWRTGGANTNLISGDWKCTVSLLGLDGIPNFQRSATPVAHDPNDPHDYSVTVDFAAGDVPEGLYKLYADVDIEVTGGATAKITGFGEGPMMEFYTPE